MNKAVTIPQRAQEIGLVHGLVDDFITEDTAVWTTTATDTGTSAVSDGVGGIMVLNPSDGTVADNDEVYLQSKELFKIAAGKPIKLEAYVQFTEANTDDANVFVGLMDAPIADSLVDNGAGPKTSFSGAGFYKVDGGTRWQLIYSDGATQTKVDLTETNSLTKAAVSAGGSSYVKLGVEIVPLSATLCSIIFYVDGVAVYKMNDKTYANATEMAVAFGLKNGGANQETLRIDWVACHQRRV